MIPDWLEHFVIRFGFESWFWVGVTFWLYLGCDIGDDKGADVLQDVAYTRLVGAFSNAKVPTN